MYYKTLIGAPSVLMALNVIPCSETFGKNLVGVNVTSLGLRSVLELWNLSDSASEAVVCKCFQIRQV